MVKSNSATEKEMVANGVTQTEKKPKDPPKKRRKATPPMWRVLSSARKIFDAQLSKSNDTKRLCINNFMKAETQDEDKFWSDYFEQVDRLLDSRRYVTECTRLKCDAVNLAEHIVFLGSTAINKVLKNGVYATLGNDIKLYVDRLSPKNADLYRDEVAAFLKDTDNPKNSSKGA